MKADQTAETDWHGLDRSEEPARQLRTKELCAGFRTITTRGVWRMSGQDCGTCAFRDGCVTNTSEPHNLLRGLIAAFSGLPFYCHYERDGGKDHSDLPIRKLPREELIALRKKLPICEGWRKKVAELATKGHFKGEVRGIHRWAGTYALLKGIIYLTPSVKVFGGFGFIMIEQQKVDTCAH